MNYTIPGKHFAILLALVTISIVHADETAVPSKMVGHWEGSAQVVVQWCEQTVLPVTLDIHSDGTVIGVVGDAELASARLKKKTNWFGRENNKRTTHIITGKLEGPIVAAEGIARKKVFIHLRVESDGLLGSLATSGSKIGGKDRMVLTATSLGLNKRA